jgi:hypothetical protein
MRSARIRGRQSLAIARIDNPYSLLQVFGRGHVITKSGAVAYVTHCTKEIMVMWNDTSLFVDPIQLCH